jgi:hypothetical protein
MFSNEQDFMGQSVPHRTVTRCVPALVVPGECALRYIDAQGVSMNSFELDPRVDTRPMDRRADAGRDALPSAVMACADRFTHALDTVVDHSELQAAVRDFAQQVRAQRVPPERALAAFKFMVFNLPAMNSRGPEERTALMADVTRMSIDAYYAE